MTSQNGQTHFKNLAANVANFLKCACHFRTFYFKELIPLLHWRYPGSNHLTQGYLNDILKSFLYLRITQEKPYGHLMRRQDHSFRLSLTILKMMLRGNNKKHYPLNIYLFKVYKENTKIICEICSKLTTVKTQEGIHWRHSAIFSQC